MTAVIVEPSDSCFTRRIVVLQDRRNNGGTTEWKVGKRGRCDDSNNEHTTAIGPRRMFDEAKNA